MTRLSDPGRGETGARIKQARLLAWQRPTDESERTALRDGRQEAADADVLAPKVRPRDLGSTTITFPDLATAQEALKEIVATPDIDGTGPVIVWWPPDADADANVVGLAVDERTGEVRIAHPWTESELAWLEAYLAAWPTVSFG